MAIASAKQGAGGKDMYPIGCQVTLSTTLDGDIVKGEVFSFDDKTKTLVLREPVSGSGTNANAGMALGEKEGYNIRMLNINFIKKVLSAEQAPAKAQPATLPYVCTKRAEQREAKALQEAKKRAQQIGVGVTRGAQKVFDQINKTLPCTWKVKDIVVIGEVTIASPYTIDNCTVVAGAEKTLEQVKKVLTK